jgi:Fur family transcriptional regulator, ferric uptake regulator
MADSAAKQGTEPHRHGSNRVVGERSTRQKRALATLMAESPNFRSAQDLFTELRIRGERVGLTTIYNQLAALADANQVDVVRTETGETLYRRCATGGHHHHLLCRVCARTVEIEGPEVERWAAQVAKQHAFVDVSHTVEIEGICAECVAARGPSGPG